ncbi:TOX high mobility group box family member 3-like [Myxocyprinus asiaticus]|uniref:TOX high mobility group box family member 3-like n=1 Tax=Myxocyprinus asiaticus TaxID=70543 RepID=UPI002222A175|nr:TOX high mobility group box family member 3-like [Myxocyprinus asiaticus]
MDVFYPSAGGNSLSGDPQNLDFPHCLGYYNYNKFGNNNNYMNMADANGALLAGADTFHTPSFGDEEFEIPPITPPPEIEPGMGLQEVNSPYPGLPDHPNSQRGLFTPQFPPQSLELPSITISRNMMEQEGINNGHPRGVGQNHLRQYPPNPTMVMRSIISMHNPNGIMSQNQLNTINKSQINTQLGLNMTGSNIAHTSPSPPASKSATPSPSSSINDDDQEEGNRVIGEKRPAPDAGKKPKTPKKKKKKDPNEPQKPVSAYALFFRDTQAAIKGQNPNATFGEVSKIVASMWDGLGEEQKQVYKSKTEAAKKEYLKALAAYRASLVSKAAAESAEAQTIRSVQQTLASTSLSPALVMPSPLSQHPSMSAAAQALQQALPRAIAPKPLQMRVGNNQIVTSVTVAHQNMTPGSVQSQLLGQMGVSSQMSPPMQPRHAAMQQMQQQQQMQQHLQHHQMQQQQMHHQQIQQQMQQQHFQHHLQQQLQQHHMQQQHQQMQQQQMQHMQQMQQMQQHQMQQHLQQSQQQSQCSPVQHSPSTPHSTSLGSPPPPPPPQPHPSQVQAHAQVLSQVSIY